MKKENLYFQIINKCLVTKEYKHIRFVFVLMQRLLYKDLVI